MADQPTEIDKLDQPYPTWFLLLVPIFVIVFLSPLVFPFAGDWTWLEGWIFVLSLALNVGIGTAVINRQNPRVLRNRSRLKKQGLTRATEKSASSDRFIMPWVLRTLAATQAPVLIYGHTHREDLVQMPTGQVVANCGTWASAHRPCTAICVDHHAVELLEIAA